MSDAEDSDLVQGCISGSTRAWRTFPNGYACWTLHLIYQGLKRSRTPFSADDAEDLLQDVLDDAVANGLPKTLPGAVARVCTHVTIRSMTLWK